MLIKVQEIILISNTNELAISWLALLCTVCDFHPKVTHCLLTKTISMHVI